MTVKLFLEFNKTLQQLNRFFTRNISQTGLRNLPIISAQTNGQRNSLNVRFSDGQSLEFPSLFLQDNCTCPLCFHVPSQSRSRTMKELKLDNFIQKIIHVPENVTCIWDDGHKAMFKEEWLKSRRFSSDNIQLRKRNYRDDPSLVASDHVIQKEHFLDIINKPTHLFTLLEALCSEGVALVEGAPQEKGSLRRIVDKIGFIRLTHYGHEFTVKSEKNAVNLAYTSNTLVCHTDLPYYAYPPGVQLLHCIKQFDGDGGKSHLVDGFNVAEQMRREHPQEFRILSEVPVEFYDVGKDYTDFNKVHHSPTFVLDPMTAKMIRIVYSNQQLSSYQPIPLEKVDNLYKALQLFTRICYKPENLIEFKLKEGQILVFDNWRYLHGREGFDPNKGDRLLEGCYVDWDEIYSRIRVLQSLS